METPEYFHEDCYRAATSQLAAEKHAKSGGDNFIVEDLLDLSKEDADVGMVDNGFGAAARISATDSSTVTAVDSGINSVTGGRESHLPGEIVCRDVDDAGLSGDLCEPYEELAELEWLSNFVEESFSSEDLQKQNLIPGFKSAASSAAKGDDSTSASAGTGSRSQLPFYLTEAPVPGKARSKRSRVPPCNWSSRLLLVSSVSASSSSESEPTLIQPSPGKKAAKKKEPTLAGAAADGRRCLHCATDKTPQWRTGPMGPKTLCNACGVRYKSGRLVPEYRPAASPTFVLSKHSNSHRKVLELRRQNERQQQQFLHAGCTATSTSFFEGAAEAAGDDFLIHHYLGPDFRQLI